MALEGGFHGRTLGALSVTGQPEKRDPFEPLVPGARFVPPNDVSRLLASVDDEVGLILLETVLGEGGIRTLDAGFVAAAAEPPPPLCIDEIQTGVGRTGSFFAFEQLGARPELVTLAKGLANGLPIGALLVSDDAAGAFAGRSRVHVRWESRLVQRGLRRPRCHRRGLLSNVRERSAELCAALGSLPGVLEVRGRGLMLGVELDRPASAVVDACRERGLLVLSAGDSVLRLTPPLVVTKDDVVDALSTLVAALEATS